MKFKGSFSKYGRIEIELDNGIDKIEVISPSGRSESIYPFEYQPINIEYDPEGIERIRADGAPTLLARYTPTESGRYTFLACSGDEVACREEISVLKSDDHGYVEVSDTDSRYFTYSDGAPFFWLGINLCFPTAYEQSSGTEFGLSGNVAYLGLRQYERWIKRCAENGVNIIRLWLGHDYWSPDTENAYELDAVKLSKLDRFVSMAKRYGLKLKLTLEHFRQFGYDKKALFYKRLYHNSKPCESSMEWLTSEDFTEAWMYKVGELAKRYSGDTDVVMIELWNEMNCVGGYNQPVIIEWNKKILPRVKELFPHQLVTNSLGSLDCNSTAEFYKIFPWDNTDALQIHRYLDQGAPFKICGESPIPSIKEAFDSMRTNKRPMLLAETGAVNNCHSSEFKYYSADDRGIIFVDCIYTPIFVGSAGCGNIWHWDRRYIESKNHYKLFKPLLRLVDGVDFANEGFEPVDLSSDKVHILILNGKKTTLGFIRNKSDSWMNTLRDMNEPDVVDCEFKADGKVLEIVPIWDDESAEISLQNGTVRTRELRHGVMFKITR